MNVLSLKRTSWATSRVPRLGPAGSSLFLGPVIRFLRMRWGGSTLGDSCSNDSRPGALGVWRQLSETPTFWVFVLSTTSPNKKGGRGRISVGSDGGHIFRRVVEMTCGSLRRGNTVLPVLACVSRVCSFVCQACSHPYTEVHHVRLKTRIARIRMSSVDRLQRDSAQSAAQEVRWTRPVSRERAPSAAVWVPQPPVQAGGLR